MSCYKKNNTPTTNYAPIFFVLKKNVLVLAENDRLFTLQKISTAASCKKQ